MSGVRKVEKGRQMQEDRINPKNALSQMIFIALILGLTMIEPPINVLKKEWRILTLLLRGRAGLDNQ
jgi:hypothetical protein